MSTNIASVTTLKSRVPEFYFTLITFKVDNVLFRVPRHPFQIESKVFGGKFALPLNGELAEGTSEEKPLILRGISSKEFKTLLRVLFDPAYGTRGDLNQEEWTTVLRLTHMWGFGRLFSLAIKKLDALPIDPVTKIKLGKTYHITKWLRTAYFDLAMRTDPLMLEEANKLGMGTVVKLNMVRELRYKWTIENGNAEPSQSMPQYAIKFLSSNRKKAFGSGLPLSNAPAGSASSVSSRLSSNSDAKCSGGLHVEQFDDDQCASRLEVAVHSALSDVFGCDLSSCCVAPLGESTFPPTAPTQAGLVVGSTPTSPFTFNLGASQSLGTPGLPPIPGAGPFTFGRLSGASGSTLRLFGEPSSANPRSTPSHRIKKLPRRRKR